jgi:hypothetical protein
MGSIPEYSKLLYLSKAISNSKALDSRFRYEWLSYTYFSLPKVIKLTYNKQITEVIHPSLHNIVKMCRHIALLEG